MSDQISRVELAEIAFHLGLTFAVQAIKNGTPISDVIKFIPDFEGKLKQLQKVVIDIEKKEKQNKRKVKYEKNMQTM